MADHFYASYHSFKENPSQSAAQSLVQYGVSVAQQSTDLLLKKDIYKKLIKLFPRDPSLYYYMGFALKDTHPEKALPYFQRSYDIEPRNIENMIDLCNTLYHLDRADRVLQLTFQPDFFKDHRFLILYAQSKIKEKQYHKCLEHLQTLVTYYTRNPPRTQKDRECHYSVWLNTGHMYLILGNHEKAVYYTEGAYDMSDTAVHSIDSFQNLLFMHVYTYFDHVSFFQRVKQINGVIGVTPFTTPTPTPTPTWKKGTGTPIKLGYVSSDFTGHAVSNFILPMLNHHDRKLFDIYLFANQKSAIPFEPTGNIINIVDRTDEAVANQIKDMGVDILIDLNGHTAGSRIGIFAYQPAPIQITYLGYPNTTGVQAIGYRITDAISDHPETKQLYSETLLRMKRCFLLFQSMAPPVVPRKTQSTVVLGAMNRENKNSDAVCAVWKRLLHLHPQTILLIKLDGTDTYQERMEYYTKRFDVPSKRLLLMTRMDDAGYNKMYAMIDMVLDTFPYSGTTTTCSALHHSIPVVTMYHRDYHMHNVSGSILTNMGHPELVTHDLNGYEETIKELIMNPRRVEEYKRTLRQDFLELMNPTRFMTEYEELLSGLL